VGVKAALMVARAVVNMDPVHMLMMPLPELRQLMVLLHLPHEKRPRQVVTRWAGVVFNQLLLSHA